MSLWVFTNRQVKIGKQYPQFFGPNYWVADIQQRVPLTVLVRNYNAKLCGMPPDPEMPQQCVQLVGPQKEFNFQKGQ